MSQENVEVARRLFPGPVDLVATLADPEGFEATRLVFEPLVHPDFETISAPAAIPMSASGIGFENPSQPTYKGLDGFVALFRDWFNAWESWLVTATDSSTWTRTGCSC